MPRTGWISGAASARPCASGRGAASGSADRAPGRAGSRRGIDPDHATLLAVGHPHNAALQIWAELGVGRRLPGRPRARADAAVHAGDGRPDRAVGHRAHGGGGGRSLVGHGAWQGWWAAAIGAAIVWFRIGRCDPARGCAWRLRCRPVRDRRRLRRRPGGADRGRLRRAGHARRGVPRRRHLRDPRLRARRSSWSMRAASRTSSRTRPASAGRVGEPRFDWATLIRNKDAEIARLEGIYRANLPRPAVEIVDGRAVIEDAHTVRLSKAGRRVAGPATSWSRSGAHPTLEPRDPGRRARHHLERGVRARDAAGAHPRRRRRLHRGRVRRRLRRARQRA